MVVRVIRVLITKALAGFDEKYDYSTELYEKLLIIYVQRVIIWPIF